MGFFFNLTNYSNYEYSKYSCFILPVYIILGFSNKEEVYCYISPVI
jgi:hypothetical protein